MRVLVLKLPMLKCCVVIIDSDITFTKTNYAYNVNDRFLFTWLPLNDDNCHF